MYSRNDDKRPSRPVVTSLSHALSEIDHWVSENKFDRIKDGDGLTWNLDLAIKPVPNRENTHGLLWEATVRLHVAATAEMFIETGTLHRVSDERLIALIGDADIKVALKPSVYTAKSEDEMRQIVASVVPKLKVHLMKNSFYDVKRRLIGRFVDQSQWFG